MKTNVPHDRDPNEREFVKTHVSAISALRDHAAQCPHPDVVSAAVMGVLPYEEAAKVNAHVSACSMCSILVEGFAGVSTDDVQAETLEDGAAAERLLGKIRKQIGQEKRRARWWLGWSVPRFAAVAAGLIIVAGLVVLSVRWGAPSEPPQIARVDPGPQPAPVFYMPLEPAELKLPLDAIMWRGAEDPPAKVYFEELGKALEPYNKGDYAGARQALAALSVRHPQAVEPHFYLGVSDLLDNHVAEARASLERARQVSTPLLAADIDWYLAIANEREGRVAEASTLVEGLCEKENAYQKRACVLVPQLKVRKP
jgi:hypothetical protein